MNDQIPPPNSPLARHVQNVKDREESYREVRASFGDSLEMNPRDDGRVEIHQKCGEMIDSTIKLNYKEIIWLKKQLERIVG